MSNAPWSFDEARAAAQQASRNQRSAEDFIKSSYAQYAEAERAYRVALAKAIVRLHADGVAWSSTADLARGDELVARLKYERDVAEGVRECASQAAWRATHDRQDTARFLEWSRRVALRTDEPVAEDFGPPIGARV